MARVNTYLNFQGQAEEAFTFYAETFGTEITMLTRFSDMPAMGLGALLAEEQGLVLHAELPILAGLVAAGAHPYLTTPEHSRMAREALGPGPVLAPEQALVLEEDPGAARRTARSYLDRYLRLPNYSASPRRLGWRPEDVVDGGSDALLDALVPHGSPDDVAAAALAQVRAGADHVCVQALTEGGEPTAGRSRCSGPG